MGTPNPEAEYPAASAAQPLDGFRLSHRWEETVVGDMLMDTLDATVLHDDGDVLTISMKNHDRMAAWTVIPAAVDASVTFDAAVTGSPLSVTCVNARVSSPGIPRPQGAYSFCISPSGQWALSRYVDGESTPIVPYTPNAAILPDTNRVALSFERDRLDFSVNDTRLLEVYDASLTQGAVDLVCGTPQGASVLAKCRFANLRGEFSAPR
jgi:hypothetical protein